MVKQASSAVPSPVSQDSPRILQWGINLFFLALSALIVVPFLLVLSISLTREQSLLDFGYRFIPKEFSLQAYRLIFANPGQLLRAYGVTALVTAIGTTAALFLTSLIAFVIARRDYAYRRATTLFIFFTMLFSPGIVPTYILVTRVMHLQNTIWALIVPYLLNPFHVMLLKGFLDKLPGEIVESAKIDGCSEFRIYSRIVLPLAKPALATVGLLIAFAYWNDWWLGLLFIDNQNQVPLQLLLYRIMNQIEFLSNQFIHSNVAVDLSQFPSLSTRMAMAILAAGPMMFIFPLFQRFFVGGLTVGSVKG
ncbi:carbohydrate ABC transporter permease [Cohnella hongkongensis]|uniref:Carbohydrate ABC transporter permease n=1 Tax=Cohnella hongkongensis TaxID=178337 RepID=A0ABV9FFA5_9BACL